MEDENVAVLAVMTKLNSELITQFFHACIDEICGQKAVTFAQFDKSIEWSEDEFRIAHKFVVSLFEKPALLYLDDEKMPEQYVQLPTELQACVRKCATARRQQLINALTLKNLIRTGPTMVDFDWRLKWVMGSSQLATLREPLLQLDLTVQDRNSQRIVDLELNRNELDMLITQLEAANSKISENS